MDDFGRKYDKARQRQELAKAIAYLTDHLAEKIHLRDLCRAAGVSPRTLGYLFLRAYGVTPMAYLKRQRLAKARDGLLHADPANDTVAGIARRCGFKHMGQFSLDYRKLIGERPSATLNRHHESATLRRTLASRPRNRD